MREFNALNNYPKPANPRYISKNLRTIESRIIASYRDKEYYDGDRNNGYGGFKYDGRWQDVADFMYKEYKLSKDSAILHIGCEKGFLLHDFHEKYPDLKVCGTEISAYAVENSMPSIKSYVQIIDSFKKLPYGDHEFDLVLAMGVVYCLTLSDAISCLKEIQRVGKGKSFITLAAYKNEEDAAMFKQWTLLGSTILHVDEWLKVLHHAGYTGDYTFYTAETLNLRWKED